MHHILGKLGGCNQQLCDDEAHCRNVLVKATELANATLLQLAPHKFTPQGVTAFALLAESHISIHTWPESGTIALDIFTCGETVPTAAFEYIREQFHATGWTRQTINR